MAKLNQVKGGFFKTEIDISEYYGLEEGEVRLTLREPTEKEMYDYSLAVRQKDDAKAFKLLQAVWADCLEDWTVQKDDSDDKVDKQTMIGLIRNSSGAALYLVGEWQKKLPLAKTSAPATEKSDEPSLKAAE